MMFGRSSAFVPPVELKITVSPLASRSAHGGWIGIGDNIAAN
jgi:hypothetical protein